MITRKWIIDTKRSNQTKYSSIKIIFPLYQTKLKYNANISKTIISQKKTNKENIDLSFYIFPEMSCIKNKIQG